MATDKISAEQMLEEVADKLVIYLKDGRISPQSFFNKLDLQINNIEELLSLHFILNEKVKQFISKLPWRIRSIKTSTKKVNRYYQNEVRGRINWQATISKRCKQYYRDNTIFVCEQTNKDYNITENIILKKLISVIYEIISDVLEGKPANYKWLDGWLGDKKLAVGLEELYFRNIYLKKIDIHKVIITDRMIQYAKNSRNILYKEAAELLEFYREYVEKGKWRDNNEEIIELLKNTFIKPEKESVLFELYWVMKLLDCNSENYQLQLVKREENVVAYWEKDNRNYTLYHDCDGSKLLDWSVHLDEFKVVDNEYLKRRINSLIQSKKISQIFSSQLNPKLWSGRPDIIIEIRDKKKNLIKVVIGEVKYTNKEETAKQGLKELLDYCQLIKYMGDYVKEEELEVVGLLLVDEIKLPGKNPLRGIKIKNIGNQEWIGEECFIREINF